MNQPSRAKRNAVQRLAAVLLLAVGSLPALTAPAAAISAIPGGFASWSALYAEQLRMNAGADRIVAAGEKLADNGYAGIVAAPESRTIVLYWRGDLPASVRAVVDDVARTTSVEVRPARYTLAQMSATTQQILHAGDPKTTTVVEVSPNVDGSGVTVKAIGGRLDSAAAAIAGTGVKVTVESAGGQPIQASRDNDSPPYYGGAKWGQVNWVPDCSTGFAVWRLGRPMMLTAAHCAGAGVMTKDGGGDLMGVTRDRMPWLDSMLIDVSSGPFMFDGHYINSFTKPVVGVQTVYDGSWLCTSGAFSGVICNMRVHRALVGYQSVGGAVYPAYHVRNVSGTGAVAGKGDSGGPVFALDTNPSRVRAVGIITAGEWGTNTTCVGTINRECWYGMYFVHVYDSGDTAGFSIRTYS